MKKLFCIIALLAALLLLCSCSSAFDDFQETTDPSGTGLTPGGMDEISRELDSSSAAAADSKDSTSATNVADTTTSSVPTTTPQQPDTSVTGSVDTPSTTPAPADTTTARPTTSTTPAPDSTASNTTAPTTTRPAESTTVPSQSTTKPSQSTTAPSGGTTATPPDTLEPDLFVDISVYWTESGEVWHLSQSCSSLKNAKSISSGSVSAAMQAGKVRVCKRCG